MPSVKGFGSVEAQTYADLELRSRWGGLSGLPALTPAQAELFCRLRRARPDWHPQRAAHFAWMRIDPYHGRGGLYSRDVAGAGDGWRLTGFLAALREDASDVEDVIREHPEQAVRLRDWLRRMERLGHDRENDPHMRDGVGYYYEALSELGYSAIDIEQRRREFEAPRG